MRHDWSNLPERLMYIAEVADKYVIYPGRNDLYDVMLDSLSASAIQELSQLYCEIARRNDGPEFYRWHAGQERLSRRDRGAMRPVLELFGIFTQLAKRGIEPFTSKTAVFDDRDEKVDWSALPASLSYLIGPAMKYGHIHGDDDVEEFIERITDAQKMELRALSDEIGQRKDSCAINEWLDRHRSSFDLAAFRIHWCLNLVGLLELREA